MPSGPEKRTRGLTGFVYRRIVGTSRLVGRGADAVLGELASWLSAEVDDPPETLRRRAILAALNGVMGDRLAADSNPLATRMTLLCRGCELNGDSPETDVGGRVVLLVHGLCMNEAAWQLGDEAGYGARLEALGYVPVYLRYNSGLHISENGRALADRLERLVEEWPVPVETLDVVGHSMGGLVVRSAVHLAREQKMRWPERVGSVVFLGTPHHGAPLERAGNGVDALLDLTPYTAPFAALGQLRSAGITDLRYGVVRDEDWQGRDRFRRGPDRPYGLPLPDGIACYAIAATRSGKRRGRLRGDGLVPVRSALGLHQDPERCLEFPEASQRIFYATHHLDLLRSRSVADQVTAWFEGTAA